MASASQIKSPSDQLAGTRGLQVLSNAYNRSRYDIGFNSSKKSFDSTFDPYAGICPVCLHSDVIYLNLPAGDLC